MGAADKPVHRVITDKELFVFKNKILFNQIEEKKIVLDPLNLICQVRLQGGWLVIGMANFRFEKKSERKKYILK